VRDGPLPVEEGLVKTRLAGRVGSLLAVFAIVAMAVAPGVVAADAPQVSVSMVGGTATATEGVPFAVTLTYVEMDAPATEVFAIHVDWGDGTSLDRSATGMAAIDLSHTYAAGGQNVPYSTYTATATVTDAESNSGTGSLEVRADDVAPVVTAVPATVAQGFSGTVRIASFTDASLAPWFVTVDGDVGGVHQTMTLQAPGPIEIPFSASSGSQTLTVTVQDSGAMSSSASTTITVAAPAGPSVTAPPDQTVTSQMAAMYAGGMYPYSLGSFADPGGAAAGPWSWRVDWEDGTSSSGTTASQVLPTAPHRYDPGAHQAHLVVTNAAGASGDAHFNVTVAGDMMVTVPDDGFGLEGVPTTVWVIFYDPYPPSSTAPYSIHLEFGDGTSQNQTWSGSTTALLSFVHTYAATSAATIYTDRATVTDAQGRTGSATASVLVQDVAPVLTAPATLSVPEGPAVNLTMGTFTDASAGPWQVMIRRSDGGQLTLTLQTPSAIVVPWNPGWGNQGAQVTVTDRFGLMSSANIQVSTVNSPPVVGAISLVGDTIGGQPIVGHVIGAKATYTDPGLSTTPITETYTCTVDFGDGSAPVSNPTAGQGQCGAIHTYANAGTFTIRATVTDSNGGSGSSSLTVSVQSGAPQVGPIVVPGPLVAGQTFVATTSFTATSPKRCAVDYGDGTWAEATIAGSTCSAPSHAYATAGTYTITFGVWDSYGAYGSAQATVVVGSAPPPAITEAHFTPSPAIEGSPVEIVATFTAGPAGTPAGTVTCHVDYGDGSGAVTGSVSGYQCFGPAHLYSGLGPYTATVSIVDGRGAVGSATVSVTVTNDPPTVDSISVPLTFEVGVPITARVEFSDRGAVVTNETYTCTVDYGDGAGPQLGSLAGTTCTGPVYAYAQNGYHTVTAMITDSNGGVGMGTESIYLANVAPMITTLAFDPGPTAQGTPVSLVATFTDPGYGTTPETYTCYVYYGDSTGAQLGTVVGNQCHGPAHVFPGLGPYTVVVYVDDSNGGSGWAETDITLLNVAPVINFYGGVLFGQSGVAQSAYVTFSDPGAAPGNPPETYTCTIDYGDGTGVHPGVIAADRCTGPIHTYATKGHYTFLATVTDSSGGVGTYSVSIDIYNPWPSVGAVSAPDSVIQGSSVTASAPFVSTGLDPADTCTIDYGDGTGPIAATVTGTTCQGPAHVYATPGTFQITVKVTSEIGSSASGSKSIAVASLGPVVGPISTPASIVEGTAFAASATFTPAAPLQTHTCKVNYGDGSGDLAGVVTATTCKGPNHAYGDSSSRTITIAVKSSAGYTGTASKAVTVKDVLPTITKLTAPSTSKLGTSVATSITFTDPGFAETHSVVWDWGDGFQTNVPVAVGVRTVSASHTYARAGSYGAYVQISDNPTLTNFAVAVYDPARTLTASGSANSPKGACLLTKACGVASTAGFSISASYARNATTPTASLAYSATGISITANSADYFIAVNGTALIHGKCTVNGKAGYNYSVSLVDGRPDTLGLFVYDNNGVRVYYTDPGPLKSGSIAIK